MLTLRELSALANLGDHLALRSGTSRSKARELIGRLSEDIDLAVDRFTLGFGGDASPERASSNSQCKTRPDDLSAA